MGDDSKSIEDMSLNSAEVGAHVDRDFEESQLQLHNDLHEHLQSLVGRADYSDLEFVCKGGEKVKASRLLLLGRSEVIDKMLTNGMVESSTRVIKLPEISSAVLLYILDILYVGNSALHPLTSWTMALEAFSAAHFFLLPHVNRVIRKFMWREVVQAAESLSYAEAARMLTAAMELKCMDDEDVVLIKLVHLLNVKWMEVDCSINLSEEAVDYILRKTKPLSKKGLSLDEYFRVRGVVLWVACQGERDLESAEKVEKLINTAMPLAENDLYEMGTTDADTVITWLPRSLVTDSDNEKLCHLLSKAARKHSLERLLIGIDWSRIPAVLITKIVRPMQLLSSSKYIEILETHAIHSAVRPTCEWVHPDVYTTDSNGFAIRKSGEGPGCAMCQVKACSEFETLEWRLYLDRMGSQDIQLGVACGGLSLSRKVIDGMLESSGEKVYVMRVTADNEPKCRCGSNFGYPCPCCGAYRYPNMENFGILASRQDHTTKFFSSPFGSIAVLFTCNQKERWCTASVEGFRDSSGDFATAKNLPPGSIFPLVNLGQSAGPRARIALVSGFKMF